MESGPTLEKDTFISFEINQVYPRLYQGSYEGAQSWSDIKGLKITHIINLVPEMRNTHGRRGINYYNMKLDDTLEQDLREALKETNYTIDKILKENNTNRVLVHCLHGKSRSGAVVCAYVMNKEKWDYTTASKFCKRGRPQFEPNQNFEGQLIAR